MQFYSDPSREHETYALPDCEVFYRTEKENLEYGFLDSDGSPMPSGYYYWFCFPGCMPDSDPFGLFTSEEEAISDCRSNFSDEEEN